MVHNMQYLVNQKFSENLNKHVYLYFHISPIMCINMSNF